MTLHNELYDVVKRLQKDFPDLINLIPINTFYSDDMYEVMKSLLQTAQEKLDHEREFPVECTSCYSESGEVHCVVCYEDQQIELRQAYDKIDRLTKELENE